MRARNKQIPIKILEINNTYWLKNNYVLFGLLCQANPTAEYVAGEEYVYNEQTFILSHTLKTTEEKPFTAMPSFHVLNKAGELQGQLHLLPLGMIYFQDFNANRNDIKTSLRAITKTIHETKKAYKISKYILNPIGESFKYLQEKIKTMVYEPERLQEYHAFLSFYLNCLNDAECWPQVYVTEDTLESQTFDFALAQFLSVSKNIRLFIDSSNYYFQGKRIVFEAMFVRRERNENRGECFDILKQKPIGEGSYSTVYKVETVSVAFNAKPKLKQHKYVYKVSLDDDLKQEYEDTKTIDHLKKSRNYQPGFYALPYLGKNLMDYFNKYFLVMPASLFVRDMLKISAHLYSAVLEQMKGKYHGDLKSDNFCINDEGKISVIDYTRHNAHTTRYAAPEVLTAMNGRAGTVKSDVYSLARSLVEMWGGDPLLENKNGNDVIRNAVLTSEPVDLLKNVFDSMKNNYTEKEFPSDLLVRYQAILLACHDRDSEKRLSIKEAANAFNEVFQQFEAQFYKKPQL